MPKLLWNTFIVLSALTLAACQQREETMDYYLLHPLQVIRAAEACQASASSEQHCRLVMEAANKIMELVEEHQRHPEAFGQRILSAEMKFAETGQNELEMKTLLAVVGLSGPE